MAGNGADGFVVARDEVELEGLALARLEVARGALALHLEVVLQRAGVGHDEAHLSRRDSDVGWGEGELAERHIDRRDLRAGSHLGGAVAHAHRDPRDDERHDRHGRGEVQGEAASMIHREPRCRSAGCAARVLPSPRPGPSARDGGGRTFLRWLQFVLHEPYLKGVPVSLLTEPAVQRPSEAAGQPTEPSTPSPKEASAGPEPVVKVRRRTIDAVLIGAGVVVTLVLVVAGSLLTWGNRFADRLRRPGALLPEHRLPRRGRPGGAGPDRPRGLRRPAGEHRRRGRGLRQLHRRPPRRHRRRRHLRRPRRPRARRQRRRRRRPRTAGRPRPRSRRCRRTPPPSPGSATPCSRARRCGGCCSRPSPGRRSAGSPASPPSWPSWPQA